MIRSLVVLVVVGCGPGLAARDPRVLARDVVVERAGSASELASLMSEGVVNGGLWFADPACAARFGVAGAIAKDQVSAFAGCVARLQLKASAREDALGDAVVMEYAPGIEVETRVRPDGTGGWHLTWIGFASRRAGDPDAPTITHAALEALRTGGARDPIIDPALTASLGTEPHHTWLKICLDGQGNVTHLDDYETSSSKLAGAFIEAASRWSFRPFVTVQGATAACAMVQMLYPPGAPRSTEVLPLPPPPSRGKKPIVIATSKSKLIEGKRIQGDRAIGPDEATQKQMKAQRVDQIEGAFRICLDEQGNVESVLPVRSTGFAAYDERLIAGMQTWKYSPYQIDDQPVPVCTQIIFRYKQGYRPR